MKKYIVIDVALFIGSGTVLFILFSFCLGNGSKSDTLLATLSFLFAATATLLGRLTQRIRRLENEIKQFSENMKGSVPSIDAKK